MSRNLSAAWFLFLLASMGCASAPVRMPGVVRFYPQIDGEGASIEKSAVGFTFVRKGKAATCRVRLVTMAEHLVVHVDIRNETSKEPLQIMSAVAYDSTNTLLKSEHSSAVTARHKETASEVSAKAHAASQQSQAALRGARYGGSGADWGALGQGIASAISAGLLGAEAAQVKDQEKYVRENAYQNSPIPKGFGDRGLIFFIRGDRVPPYNLKLEITDGVDSEVYNFPFRMVSVRDLWDFIAELPEDDGQSLVLTLSHNEKVDLAQFADKAWKDKPRREEMKGSYPQKYSLLKWLHGGGWRASSGYRPKTIGESPSRVELDTPY